MFSFILFSLFSEKGKQKKIIYWKEWSQIYDMKKNEKKSM